MPPAAGRCQDQRFRLATQLSTISAFSRSNALPRARMRSRFLGSMTAAPRIWLRIPLPIVV